MQTTDYKGKLSTSDSTPLNKNSNVLNFHSTRLNSTQLSLNNNSTKSRPQSTNNGEWARAFIKEHRLSKSTLCTSEYFKQLDLKLKQAIRYQMRKQQPSSKADKTKLNSRFNFNFPQKSRGVLDIKLASFLTVPTLISEYIVLTFSYLFYLNLGFSVSISILAATCVELFFMR